MRRPLMKRNSILRFRYLSLLPLCLAVSAQVISSNQPAPQGPVSYASANQLNALLSQLEETSQAAQLDLAKMRVEKWKADSGTKRQAEGNSESIQRNLKSALPEIISELRASPESLTYTFKLYRNLDALYDVFESVAESAGAFGSKDEFQSLENDVSTFEKTAAFGGRPHGNAGGAKESEVTRLRAALQSAQANTPAPPPKKIVVDDAAPAKKPAQEEVCHAGQPSQRPERPLPSPRRSSSEVGLVEFHCPAAKLCIHQSTRVRTRFQRLSIPNILKHLQLQAWNSARRAGVYTYKAACFGWERGSLTLGPQAERTYNGG